MKIRRVTNYILLLAVVCVTTQFQRIICTENNGGASFQEHLQNSFDSFKTNLQNQLNSFQSSLQDPKNSFNNFQADLQEKQNSFLQSLLHGNFMIPQNKPKDSQEKQNPFFQFLLGHLPVQNDSDKNNDETSAAEHDECPNIVSRSGWGARPQKVIEYMIVPVQYVIIQHTATPICSTPSDCVSRVAGIQAYHMDTLHFDDIGFSFLIGGDGNVYEGVGWHKIGAHTRGYNSKALGIAVIGNFNDKLPNENQLNALKKLLSCGVSLGEIDTDYKLLAHRQVSATESPGVTFFQELQKWPQWAEQP